MRKTLRWTMAASAMLGWLAAPSVADKLEEAEIFFEINDTDGDAGIQVFLDGDDWKRMVIYDPDGKQLLQVKGKSGVAKQGLTELFFESAEPSFDEQPLADLLARFPEGRYTFEGVTSEGEPITGRTRLTHALPDAPLIVFPDEEAVDPDDAVFQWQAVADPPGSEIVSYEVIVVCEDPDVEMSAIVGPDVTSLTIPPEFLDQGSEECKWEIIAKEESGNQTITEGEFEVD